jgi:hypothetical protein
LNHSPKGDFFNPQIFFGDKGTKFTKKAQAKKPER